MQRRVLFFADGDEHIAEASQEISRELCVEGNSQARGAGRNAGRPYRPHSEAGVVQETRKADCAVILSEENRNDLRVAASDIKTGFTQLSSQECGQCDEIISLPIGGSDDADRGSHLRCHVGRQCGAEDKSSRSIDKILLELFRTAHEAAHTR